MSKNKKYQHGFKSPDDYFDSFEDRLFSKLSEDKLPGDSGFKAPDGYFDAVEDTIMSRIAEENQTPVIPLYRRKIFLYAASIAACAALVFSVYTPETTISENDLEFADIEAYIDNGELDIDPYEIAQLLNEEDIEELSAEDDFFSEESLENYLLEHIDDTSLLIE